MLDDIGRKLIAAVADTGQAVTVEINGHWVNFAGRDSFEQDGKTTTLTGRLTKRPKQGFRAPQEYMLLRSRDDGYVISERDILDVRIQWTDSMRVTTLEWARQHPGSPSS
jgi:hypothetical protein